MIIPEKAILFNKGMFLIVAMGFLLYPLINLLVNKFTAVYLYLFGAIVVIWCFIFSFLK